MIIIAIINNDGDGVGEMKMIMVMTMMAKELKWYKYDDYCDGDDCEITMMTMVVVVEVKW